MRVWLKKRPSERFTVPDGAIPGLMMRVGPRAMTWTLLLRVQGEGGVTARGAQKKGKKCRVHLGEYPTVTLESARAAASLYLEQAKKGLNPIRALEQAATSGGPSIQELGQVFMDEYANMKGLKSARKYQQAIDTHINPNLGQLQAQSLSREDVRRAVKKVMVKQPRGDGPRDRPRGGKEATRTMLSVLRAMISWAIDESKLRRQDNPVSNMERNLPSKVKRTRVLNLDESRDAWRAAADIGYPFGPVYQLDMLTGNRKIEWSACKVSYLKLKEGLQIIPADAYKSNHVHVVPLVPEAIAILEWVLANHYPTKGEYLFSGTDGAKPISGWSKAHRRLFDAIQANTGIYPDVWKPHDVRRTVATRVAEVLGMQGDKVLKRVLGHADRDVTSIYNQYRYVKEVRSVLTQWKDDLLATEKMNYVLPQSRFYKSGFDDSSVAVAA